MIINFKSFTYYHYYSVLISYGSLIFQMDFNYRFMFKAKGLNTYFYLNYFNS